MHAQVWAHSDPGLKRGSNQDSYLVDEALGLFVVADGMGGHNGGEVASSMAVQTSKIVVAESKPQNLSPRDLLKKIFSDASAKIYDRARNESELSGMGTTMVLSYLENDVLYVGNVGDSRCYLLRDQYLWQLTEDHSLMNEQVRAGILSPEAAALVIAKNVITRSVGYEREVVCDVLEREVRPGEIYLMCSDGLHGLVSDKRIAEIIDKNPIDNVVQILIDEAKKNGGDDNITAVLVKITDSKN